MNNTIINESFASPPPPAIAAWIGMDWGDKEHATCLFAPADSQLKREKFKHSAESLHQWLKGLGERFEGRTVALALEANRGPLLHVFAEYPWLEVYPVNPVTSARFRKAFTPSGAKDDQPDADLLLDILRCHTSKLKVLDRQDDQTRQLDLLTRARRDTVDRRTQCNNQLIALLKDYYPQAIELTGEDLTSPMALDFLTRWPDLIDLKIARPTTIRDFYQAHNVRRPERIEERLELIKKAVCLTTDQVVIRVSKLQLKLLVDMIKTLNKHIETFEAEIKLKLGEHPDGALFKEFPGAGPALAPRLVAACGTDRGRFESAAAMQKYFGVAPVREKSGGQLWTHWRWNAPNFSRQTFVEWAGQTVVWCPWAKCYYRHMKDKGKKHHVILRALAFKWIRILWKCWQTGELYDDARYVASLKKRKSPYVPKEKEM